MPLAKPRRQPSVKSRRRGKVLMKDPSEEALLRAAEAARYVSTPTIVLRRALQWDPHCLARFRTPANAQAHGI